MIEQNKEFKKYRTKTDTDKRHFHRIHISLILLLGVALMLSGCSRQVTLSKSEINALWQLYYAREFTESLEEKLSSEQRKAIMKEVASENRLDYAQIMVQLQSSDPDRFQKLFY